MDFDEAAMLPLKTYKKRCRIAYPFKNSHFDEIFKHINEIQRNEYLHTKTHT